MPEAKPTPVNDADTDPGRLVTIASFRDEAKAHMAASKLESEGIESVITDLVRIASANRPAELKVLSEDLAAASAILISTPARDSLIGP